MYKDLSSVSSIKKLILMVAFYKAPLNQPTHGTSNDKLSPDYVLAI